MISIFPTAKPQFQGDNVLKLAFQVVTIFQWVSQRAKEGAYHKILTPSHLPHREDAKILYNAREGGTCRGSAFRFPCPCAEGSSLKPLFVRAPCLWSGPC